MLAEARLIRGRLGRSWVERVGGSEQRVRGAQVQGAGDGVEAELAGAGQTAELEQGDVAVRDAGGCGQAALAPALGVAQAGDALAEGVWIGEGLSWWWCSMSVRVRAAPLCYCSEYCSITEHSD